MIRPTHLDMKEYSRRTIFALLPAVALSACSGRRSEKKEADGARGTFNPPLYPNETPELRGLINKWADRYQIPRELVHRQAVRESTHRPWARNGPYWGLLQILPQTARTMGHRGPPKELLNPDVNLKYAGKYLRGAYIVSGGSIEGAMKWYAKGYYYEAKRKGLLVETGLRPG
ncbi:lytic transglycosylase domain-containing protein [Aliiroseovarius sp. S2029]|uniref:transglycosylase SLT domain-containing protein n=1 Tax=Aliiroseovarius sp. S2029 TaxID=2936988 RepID=UPI0020BE38CE|nr:lytic transglycosylase domain-containing protein [Aliiroseovarius sp. S2029]